MIKPNPTIIMLTCYDCDITTANPLFFTRARKGMTEGEYMFQMKFTGIYLCILQMLHTCTKYSLH